MLRDALVKTAFSFPFPYWNQGRESLAVSRFFLRYG